PNRFRRNRLDQRFGDGTAAELRLRRVEREEWQQTCERKNNGQFHAGRGRFDWFTAESAEVAEVTNNDREEDLHEGRKDREAGHLFGRGLRDLIQQVFSAPSASSAVKPKVEGKQL